MDGGDDPFSEISGAFSGVFQETAVELGERAESDVQSNLADACVAAGEAFFGLEDAFPIVKFRQRGAGGGFENAAQMVRADSCDFRDVGQREWFVECTAKVVANPLDGFGEFVCGRGGLAFKFAGQLHGEDDQHFDDGIVMLVVNDLAGEIGFT